MHKLKLNFVWKMHKYVIIFSLLLTNGCSREYHIKKHLYGHVKTRNTKLIYPEFDTCTNDNDLRLQKDYTTSEQGNWSTFFNKFLFDTLEEPDSYNEQLLFDFDFSSDDSFPLYLLRVPVLWLLVNFLILLVSVVVIPLLGGICVLILGSIIFVIAKSIKFIGRHGIIYHEKIRRARENIIIPRKYRNVKKKFRMPNYFRNYSDEEVPKELVTVLTDDSQTNSENEEEERLIQEMEKRSKQQKDGASEVDEILPTNEQDPMLAADTVVTYGPGGRQGQGQGQGQPTSPGGVNLTPNPILVKPSTGLKAPLFQIQSLTTTDSASGSASGKGHSGSGTDQSGDGDDEYEEDDPHHVVQIPVGIKVQSPDGKLRVHVKKKKNIVETGYGNVQAPPPPNLPYGTGNVAMKKIESISSRPKLAAMEWRDAVRKIHKLDPDVSQTKTHAGIQKFRDEMLHEVLLAKQKKKMAKNKAKAAAKAKTVKKGKDGKVKGKSAGTGNNTKGNKKVGPAPVPAPAPVHAPVMPAKVVAPPTPPAPAPASISAPPPVPVPSTVTPPAPPKPPTPAPAPAPAPVKAAGAGHATGQSRQHTNAKEKPEETVQIVKSGKPQWR